MIQMMLGAPGIEAADFSSVRAASTAPRRSPTTCWSRVSTSFGCEFLQVYGLTETTGSVTQLDERDPVGRPDLLRSCGKPYPWVELRIVDDDGRRSQSAARWARHGRDRRRTCAATGSDPDATAATAPTKAAEAGTPVTSTRDGFFYLNDRKKDMIVSGGRTCTRPRSRTC